MSDWKKRIVGEADVDPATLKPHAANWRVHPKRQQQAMVDILDEVGVVQQVLVNRRTGVIIDGHMRVRLALRNHEPTVPVVFVDLSEPEEYTALATINPLATLAYEDRQQRRDVALAIESPSLAIRALIQRDEIERADAKRREADASRGKLSDEEIELFGEDEGPDPAPVRAAPDPEPAPVVAPPADATKQVPREENAGIAFRLPFAEWQVVMHRLEELRVELGVDTVTEVVVALLDGYDDEGDDGAA